MILLLNGCIIPHFNIHFQWLHLTFLWLFKMWPFAGTYTDPCYFSRIFVHVNCLLVSHAPVCRAIFWPNILREHRILLEIAERTRWKCSKLIKLSFPLEDPYLNMILLWGILNMRYTDETFRHKKLYLHRNWFEPNLVVTHTNQSSASSKIFPFEKKNMKYGKIFDQNSEYHWWQMIW